MKTILQYFIVFVTFTQANFGYATQEFKCGKADNRESPYLWVQKDDKIIKLDMVELLDVAENFKLAIPYLLDGSLPLDLIEKKKTFFRIELESLVANEEKTASIRWDNSNDDQGLAFIMTDRAPKRCIPLSKGGKASKDNVCMALESASGSPGKPTTRRPSLPPVTAKISFWKKGQVAKQHVFEIPATSLFQVISSTEDYETVTGADDPVSTRFRKVEISLGGLSSLEFHSKPCISREI